MRSWEGLLELTDVLDALAQHHLMENFTARQAHKTRHGMSLLNHTISDLQLHIRVIILRLPRIHQGRDGIALRIMVERWTRDRACASVTLPIRQYQCIARRLASSGGVTHDAGAVAVLCDRLEV